MKKRFLFRCSECESTRRIRFDRSVRNPTAELPLTWLSVKDSLVCSFHCAKKKYQSLTDKSIADRVAEKFFGALSMVPGLK